MHTLSFISTTIVFCLFMALAVTDARSCVCSGADSVDVAFSDADMVVYAKILSEKQSAYTDDEGEVFVRREYTLIVMHMFKSQADADTIIFIPSGQGTSCERTYVVGSEYIIYGYRYVYPQPKSPHPIISAGFCSRTGLASTEELSKLHEFLKRKVRDIRLND